ncbi:hypothetical protein NKH18_51075 [Streptomyces sp. M10(2022)]
MLEKENTALELCRALYALGTHGGTDGGRRAAALERAHELAVDHGADAWAERITRKRAERSHATSSDGVRLMPSERKVARLAAAGLSNAEILSRLGTSSRMVEMHLTHS